jgi:hypothetical protein
VRIFHRTKDFSRRMGTEPFTRRAFGTRPSSSDRGAASVCATRRRRRSGGKGICPFR